MFFQAQSDSIGSGPFPPKGCRKVNAPSEAHGWNSSAPWPVVGAVGEHRPQTRIDLPKEIQKQHVMRKVEGKQPSADLRPFWWSHVPRNTIWPHRKALEIHMVSPTRLGRCISPTPIKSSQHVPVAYYPMAAIKIYKNHEKSPQSPSPEPSHPHTSSCSWAPHPPLARRDRWLSLRFLAILGWEWNIARYGWEITKKNSHFNIANDSNLGIFPKNDHFESCQYGKWLKQMEIPSGKRLNNYGTSLFLMGKSTRNAHFQWWKLKPLESPWKQIPSLNATSPDSPGPNATCHRRRHRQTPKAATHLAFSSRGQLWATLFRL